MCIRRVSCYRCGCVYTRTLCGTLQVWLCGGRLVHLACSKLGHIARPQPYTFPEGRYETEIHNYKRAIEVWMGPYKKLVYDHHPKMKVRARV